MSVLQDALTGIASVLSLLKCLIMQSILSTGKNTGLDTGFFPDVDSSWKV